MLVPRRLLLGIHPSWQQHRVDTGHNPTLAERDSINDLARFLVILHGQQQMPCRNPRPLVVPSSVTSQLQHFGSEVFQNSSKVDCSTFPTLPEVRLAFNFRRHLATGKMTPARMDRVVRNREAAEVTSDNFWLLVKGSFP